MQAVILAGGKGTRLHPLTTNIPKPMVPIFDRPVLEHTIHLLRSHSITHITLTLNYRANDIMSYFGGGSRWGVHIQYAIEDSPLGTAGGLRAMKPLLNDTFLVLSGDGVTDFNLSGAIAEHKRRQAKATMLLYSIPDANARSEFGVVETDRDGNIRRFVEKPRPDQAFSDTVNTGIYIFEPWIINHIPENRPFDFSRNLFPRLLEENVRFLGHRASGYWCDIGTLGQYRQVHLDALAGKIKLNFGAEEISQGVWIGKGAAMHPSVQFNGPCYVGSDAQILARAVIGEGSVLGIGSRIGMGSHIASSVVGANAHVGTNVNLSDCIVGKGYRLSDGHQLHSTVLTRDLGPVTICTRTGKALSETPNPTAAAA